MDPSPGQPRSGYLTFATCNLSPLVRSSRVLLLLIFPFLATSVCIETWEASPVSPRQTIEASSPDKVKLRLTDGSELELEYPVVEGESIVSEGTTQASN